MVRVAVALVLMGCDPGARAPVSDAVVTAAPAVAPEPSPPRLEEVSLQVPEDDDVLAARLSEIEAVLRDPSADGPGLESHGHLQQRIYRVLARDPDRARRVRAMLDPRWHVAFDGNLEGTRRSSATVTRRRADLPPWTIAPPDDVATLLAAYDDAAAEFEVPWSILAAIHLVETRMGRIRGTSHAGARGPMQFMPGTWDAYGEGDIEDTHDAIRAAGRYLSAMGASRDLDKAIWHYNHSPDYVAAVRAFAGVMDADRAAYRGYWGWQVYYQTVAGDIWLEPGYAATERMPIETWCATTVHCP